MTREEWTERLEAWLDGELDPASAAAFEAECAADPELAGLLARRLRLREAARAALGELPAGIMTMAVHPWRRRVGWVALAAAATLALALLRPWQVRESIGLAGPQGAGLVAAPRLGEVAGEVHELAAGRLVLPGGF